MGMTDVKIEMSRNPFRRIRNRRLRRLKSQTSKSTDLPSSAATSSSSHFVNAEILAVADNSSPQSSQSSYIGVTVPNVLYWAAAKDDVDAFVRALKRVSVEKQIDFSNILQLRTLSGNTLLHAAAMKRCVANVKLLLYHSPALILKQNIHGDTPLHLAVRSRDGVLIHAVADFLSYKRRAEFNEEWINMAGIIPEIEKSVRLRNRYGNTALHEAAFQGSYFAVSKFIKVDAEACYSINNEGKSPLYLMAEAGVNLIFSDMLKLLREDEFKERSIEGLSPLLPVVLKSNKDMIDQILKYEPTFICLLDEDGKTPLHYAASVGSSDMVQYILGKKDEYALLRDKNGFLPIHTAAAQGHINVIRQLLHYGLGPTELLTHDGQNILHVAATRGNDNVVCFVLKTLSLEGLINEGDSDGNTPLHSATLNWQAKVVFTMTWDKRVDLGRVNKERLTPFDAAQHYMESPPSFDKLSN